MNFDPNQPLPLNEKKIKIMSYDKGIEHLGLQLGRNKIHLGIKTISKRDRVIQKLKQTTSVFEKSKLKKIRKSYINYGRQVAKVGSDT